MKITSIVFLFGGITLAAGAVFMPGARGNPILLVGGPIGLIALGPLFWVLSIPGAIPLDELRISLGALVPGCIMLVLGILFWIAASGLLNRKSQGWRLSEALMVLGTGMNMIPMVTHPSYIPWTALYLATGILVLLYLLTPSVKAHFKEPA